MIDRLNYESWFVDFLDGKLTTEQAETLRVFLEQHPDLAAELRELSDELPVLEADAAKAPVAKKIIVPVGGLDESNYEAAFVADYEGDLDAAGKSALHDFLEQNPFLHSERAYIYLATVTHAGETFAGKCGLKHNPSIVPLYRYAAAASVLLLLGLGAVWFTLPGENTDGYASRSVRPVFSYPDVAVTQTRPTVTSENDVYVKRTQNKPLPADRPVLAEIGGTDVTPSVALASSVFAETFVSVSEPLYAAEIMPVYERDDALTLVQALGHAIEKRVDRGEPGAVSRRDGKISPGEMAELAARPFRESEAPLLSTAVQASGKRRVKLRLGFFEADFALK